jgi:hypothetical protein
MTAYLNRSVWYGSCFARTLLTATGLREWRTPTRGHESRCGLSCGLFNAQMREPQSARLRLFECRLGIESGVDMDVQTLLEST